MFVGESGRPFGAEQLGKPVLADWTTIRNGKVESEGELAVHISESMFAHYQESYRIDIKNPSTGSGMVALAEWARNPDATPRTTKLPDGSRAVLPRWVRAHRPRHHGLRRRWPAQSRAIWQFQENLLRFWEGRPSLQDVCAQAR